MASPSYELTRLDTDTFEHMVNSLAINVLGSGQTGFGPGPDGGRDGFFEGIANYPSKKERWSGLWYIQSKFHSPHLSKDPQKWLLERIEEELQAFSSSSTRHWPDIWIVATNIDPSGAPDTGAFDRARELVQKYRPSLAKRFHIWGGSKIISFLSEHQHVADRYGEFVTPGHVIRSLYRTLAEFGASTAEIVRHFAVTEFKEHLFTKLEQAGSTTDNRPAIQDVFTDLPFEERGRPYGYALRSLARTLAQPHVVKTELQEDEAWQEWQQDPDRSRIWFIKGGPGQGKSTITQYIAQIQRAALMLAPHGPTITTKERAAAREIRKSAQDLDVWPIAPRIPVLVELKLFAQWYGESSNADGRRILAYLMERLTSKGTQPVTAAALRRAFGTGRWLFVFDGLDEVPGDVKTEVANEVIYFVDDQLLEFGCDAAVICTSRPQGYSGQFDSLESATVTLSKLSKNQALGCASPLLKYGRTESESDSFIKILEDALESNSIAELMTTPLQSHIMAIVVRDGGRPPERKWQLFARFYEIMKKREANKNFPNPELAKLLRTGDTLIRAVHNRLGFELHARAETKTGATTSMSRTDFEVLIRQVVSSLQDRNIDETVGLLMEATVERLVFVNTPENSDNVRFDIRQLQEFFAAEEIFDSGSPDLLADRTRVIAGDSHWREVVHFLLSALVESGRKTEVVNIVSVLNSLDQDETASTRMLSKRLAKGSIAVSRILSEGVLEHDKRFRNLFSACLASLCCSTEADKYLPSVTSEHTNSWLIDLLINSLEDSIESECVGAAMALVLMLADEDPRARRARDIIVGKSLSFRMAIFPSIRWLYPDRTARRIHPTWVGHVALSALSDINWTKQPTSLISRALDALAHSKGASEILEEAIGPNYSKIFEIIMGPSQRQRKSARVKQKRFGPFKVEMLEPASELNWRQWPQDVWVEMEKSSGIFQAVYSAFLLLATRSQESLERLRNITDGFSALQSLPYGVCNYFRIDQTRLADPTLAADEIVERTHPGYSVVAYYHAPSSRSDVKPSDWQKLLQELPDAFVHYATTSDNAKSIEILRSPSMLEALPFLGEMGTSISGLVASLGTVESDPLRKALLKLVKDIPQKSINSFAFVRSLAPFHLNLPVEAAFLPVILGLVVGVADRLERYHPGERMHSQRDRMMSLVTQYVVNVEDLVAIARSDEYPKDVRASAAILASFHAGDTEILNQTDFVSLYTEDNGSWMLPALFLAFSEKVYVGDMATLGKISALLTAVRSDFSARHSLNDILSEWREVSSNPVGRSMPKLWTM